MTRFSRLFLLLTGFLFALQTVAAAGIISLGTISADATPGGFNDNFTVIANVINGQIQGSATTGSSTNILANSIGELDMGDEVNPTVRDSELLGVTVDTTSAQAAYVYTGLTPATSATLTSNVSAGTAYINGFRVVKGATAQTYVASMDTYLDISQTGTYTQSAVAVGGVAPAVAANSARLAKVTTSGTAITAVVDLANRRLPGLVVPANYRSGFFVSRDTTTTIKVFPGTCEVNNTMLSKTAVTTLTLGTAGDWAGGSSLQTASTMGFVGIDASGNLRLHTTAPGFANYGVSLTVGKKRYATWSSTVYRILGWFFMNPAQQLYTSEVGNIKEGDVSNSVVSVDANVVSFTSTNLLSTSGINFYSSGNPVRVMYAVSGDSSAGQNFSYGTQILSDNGTVITDSGSAMSTQSDAAIQTNWPYLYTPSQATHLIQPQLKINTGSVNIRNRKLIISEE